MNIEFANPEYLWLLLTLPILYWFMGKVGRPVALFFSNTSTIKSIANPRRTSAGRFLVILRTASIALLMLAMARPRHPNGFSETNVNIIDIMLAIDVSGSMLCLDFWTMGEPMTRRIDVAKQVLGEFIQMRSYDRLGLVAFSGIAYLVSPTTMNHKWLSDNLERLHYGIIKDNGTSISSAITICANRLKDSLAKSKIIVLLTDGDHNVGNISPSVSAEAAAAFGIKIYTVGIGTNGISRYAYPDENGGVAKDPFGKPILKEMKSEMNIDTLKHIAEITGGKCFKATNKDQLLEIYKTIDALEKTEIKIKNYSLYDELFHWFAIAALVLLAIEALLKNTKLQRIP
ncbi:MAG: VWA domain-containing protein [Puniceicoccales bacterium]|nr:VWA domain-containing protein [Puniceicoccales bacterium]